MQPQLVPGTVEWFKELNTRVKFPAKIAFYYDKKYNVITTRIVESRAVTPATVRWDLIRPSALYFHSRDTAVLQVVECRDDTHYYELVVELSDIWVVKEEKEAPASETASETSL